MPCWCLEQSCLREMRAVQQKFPDLRFSDRKLPTTACDTTQSGCYNTYHVNLQVRKTHVNPHVNVHKGIQCQPDIHHAKWDPRSYLPYLQGTQDYKDYRNDQVRGLVRNRQRGPRPDPARGFTHPYDLGPPYCYCQGKLYPRHEHDDDFYYYDIKHENNVFQSCCVPQCESQARTFLASIRQKLQHLRKTVDPWYQTQSQKSSNKANIETNLNLAIDGTSSSQTDLQTKITNLQTAVADAENFNADPELSKYDIPPINAEKILSAAQLYRAHSGEFQQYQFEERIEAEVFFFSGSKTRNKF